VASSPVRAQLPIAHSRSPLGLPGKVPRTDEVPTLMLAVVETDATVGGIPALGARHAVLLKATCVAAAVAADIPPAADARWEVRPLERRDAPHGVRRNTSCSGRVSGSTYTMACRVENVRLSTLS
jgi:hypothetical protein